MRFILKNLLEATSLKLVKINILTGVLSEDDRNIIKRRINVMVKSDLCWMKEADNGDCDFDHEGYFLVKGEEKVSLNNSF
jgi:hypothetical protein